MKKLHVLFAAFLILSVVLGACTTTLLPPLKRPQPFRQLRPNHLRPLPLLKPLRSKPLPLKLQQLPLPLPRALRPRPKANGAPEPKSSSSRVEHPVAALRP